MHLPGSLPELPGSSHSAVLRQVCYGSHGWEFQAVAVTLLGGTSLREGKGGVTGTIFGVLLIQVIKNGLNIVGVQSIKQNAIIGSIVLMAIIIDAVVRTRSKE